MAKVYVQQNRQDFHKDKEYTAILAIEHVKGEGTCKGCAFYKGEINCDSPFSCHPSDRPDKQSVNYVVTGERDDK